VKTAKPCSDRGRKTREQHRVARAVRAPHRCDQRQGRGVVLAGVFGGVFHLKVELLI
jgi:hypothetical protein